MPKFGAPAAGHPERELDKGNEVDFVSKLKISEPFWKRSRVARSRAPGYARLGNFATAWVRGRAVSHRQARIALAVRPARAAGRTAAAAAAAGRAAEQSGPVPSERQAPPPIALRLGRGAGAGRPRTNKEGAGGGVRPPGPTCWPPLAPALQGRA